MAIRTTIDIPEPLHETLRHRAEQSGTSMRSLIIQAIEEKFSRRKKNAAYVTEPPIQRKPGGKVGPLYPKDENPHDLVFS